MRRSEDERGETEPLLRSSATSSPNPTRLQDSTRPSSYGVEEFNIANGSSTSNPPSPNFRPPSPRTRSSRSDGSINDDGPNRRPFVPERDSLLHSKLRYYQMLSPSQPDLFKPPDHLLPADLFLPYLKSGQKVGSLTTIFSIWNTMMGSGLLALPWGFGQSGVLLGLGIVTIIGVVCFYSCTLVLRHSLGKFDDFADACRHYIGPRGRTVCLFTSVILMGGVSIVYIVIMSASLFDFVSMFFYWSEGSPSDFEEPNSQYWTRTIAPIVMVALVFPLTLMTEITALLKFNQFGIGNVIFMLIFFVVKSFTSPDGVRIGSNIVLASSGFISLCGIMMVSFFIHNIIISIMKSNRNQENNTRDLCIGYLCVGLSYVIVGTLPNLAYKAEDIEPNFFDMFDIGDTYAFVARTGTLFQLTTIYPLLLYIVRTQLFGNILGHKEITRKQFVPLNIALMALSVVMSIGEVEIGVILSYLGAICGLLYIFYLPVHVHYSSIRMLGQDTLASKVIHGSIVLLGVVLLLLTVINQFIET